MAKRKTFWIGRALGYKAVGTGTITEVLASSTTIHAANEDPTLVRVVGRLLFWYQREPDAAFAESTRSTCYAGIHCVHEDIAAQNPVSEISGETWMWQGFMASQSTFVEYPTREFDSDTILPGSTLSRATQHVPTGCDHVDFDIRAMRKAPKPCEVRLMLDVTERLAQTGVSHFISGHVRMLFKAG